MKNSDSLAQADFFRQRFAFGDLVGAEMPSETDVFHVVALDTAHHKLFCSCPFFPKPCAHALALSALFQREGASLFPEISEPPVWLETLLSGRPAGIARSGSNPEKRAAQQQKTRFERLERARNGFDDLEAWLSDTVRRGLATVVSEDPAAFENLATRAADASMTGLSRNLRLLSGIPANDPDWAVRVTDALAQVYLAVRAFRKRDALPDALLHDLQNFIGIHIKKEEVLASGERIHDTWAVLGTVSEPLEDKLAVRRTWMLGAQSGRMALLLDFAFGGGGFDPGFLPGSIHQGTLVFYPSAFPQRALVQEDFHVFPKKVEKMPGFADVESFLKSYADALAVQPWLPHFAGAVLDVQVQPEKNGRFFASDISGKIFPLAVAESTGWSLVALCGGSSIHVFGEWNGREFRPLSAAGDGRVVSF